MLFRSLSKFASSRLKPEELTQKDGLEFLQFANAVAGLCVEKRGGIPSMPELKDVQKEIKES